MPSRPFAASGAAAVLVLVCGYASADPPASPPPPPPSASAATAPAPSLALLVARSDRFLTDLEGASLTVRHSLLQVRQGAELRAGSPDRASVVACISDKLNQVDALARAARMRRRALGEAVSEGRAEAAVQEADAIGGMRRNVRLLAADADGCTTPAGEAADAGNVHVTVSVDPQARR